MSLLPLLAALAALAPTQVGLSVPVIAGHLTDPGRKLSPAAKSAIEDRLTKIAEETHIDVAGWISDAPAEQADALGAAFYRRWNIGGEWDSGVFYMFPAAGPVHLILEPDHPKLTPQEQARIVAADVPGSDWQVRLDRLIDVTRAVIIPKAMRVRPWGEKRPVPALEYAAAAATVVLAALALSLRRRWQENRADRPGMGEGASPASPSPGLDEASPR